ncbi:MAG: SufD family Fe-S cluster assembly protein [Patescibacteria group bacterium]
MKNEVLKKISDTTLCLKKGELVRWVSVIDQGWRTPKRISITLAGVEAQFEWFIAIIGRGEDSFPFDVQVIHAASRTQSKITARCLLFDHAHVSFAGNAKIEKRARASDTHLGFHTLLLSDHASARMIPSLEILTHDVRASHAASVDRLSESALFYCASRGLEEDDARGLLARAFLLQDAPLPAVSACTKLLQTV